LGCDDTDNEPVYWSSQTDDDDNKPVWPSLAVGALSGVEMSSRQSRMSSHTPVKEESRLSILVKGRRHL
jgi:hypothetical protein